MAEKQGSGCSPFALENWVEIYALVAVTAATTPGKQLSRSWRRCQRSLQLEPEARVSAKLEPGNRPHGFMTTNFLCPALHFRLISKFHFRLIYVFGQLAKLTFTLLSFTSPFAFSFISCFFFLRTFEFKTVYDS